MAQIGKPTPVGIIDAAKQGLGDGPMPVLWGGHGGRDHDKMCPSHEHEQAPRCL
jgi:hypothetical protein